MSWDVFSVYTMSINAMIETNMLSSIVSVSLLAVPDISGIDADHRLGKNLEDWSEAKEKEGFCTDLSAAKENGWSSLDWIIVPRSTDKPPTCKLGDEYDEDSIMHYPGGAGASKSTLRRHRKTVLGKKNKPDESFKKNMQPSSNDAARVNAMYSTAANRKRDVTIPCSGEQELPAELPGDEPLPRPVELPTEADEGLFDIQVEEQVDNEKVSEDKEDEEFRKDREEEKEEEGGEVEKWSPFEKDE